MHRYIVLPDGHLTIGSLRYPTQPFYWSQRLRLLELGVDDRPS